MSLVIGAAGIEELPCKNVSLSEGLRTSKGVLSPRPYKHSQAVAHRKYNTCRTTLQSSRSPSTGRVGTKVFEEATVGNCRPKIFMFYWI